MDENQPNMSETERNSDDLIECPEAAMDSGYMPISRMPAFVRVSGKYRQYPSYIARPHLSSKSQLKAIPSEIASLIGDEEEMQNDEMDQDDFEFTSDADNQFGAHAFKREFFCLDVDGPYPQMAASGTIHNGITQRTHWIAKLSKRRKNLWYGRIWHKDGNVAAFPYTNVWIYARSSIFPHQRRLTTLFMGGGAPRRLTSYKYVSAYFRKVEFEYDCETGITPVLEMDTTEHPNHPPSLPNDQHLTIEKVFKRAGINARRSVGASTIPTDGPDPGTAWSDAELHDAMQIYWSRYANYPQWALWVMFAKQHDMGSGLGGIMFDDIGPNHRQGTAIFYDSFIKDAPSYDANPVAWVERMKLWTAVHEMGHAFNLAHSWQKHLGTPWISLTPEPNARSFMNYPFRVPGGEKAFFADFEQRFSDMELLFMRHAPERFVQMGNADWFDDHGFENIHTDEYGQSDFALTVSHNHTAQVFEFLEPVVLELSVTNKSTQQKILPQNILNDLSYVTVILKKDNQPARQLIPFITRLEIPKTTVLGAGKTIKDNLCVSVGRNGWDIAEPGFYTVQIALEIEGRYVVSNAYRMKIQPPTCHEEEVIAQDVFTENAGRVLAFNGSQYLKDGNMAWKQVADKMPKSRAAIHAQVALNTPLTREYRLLKVEPPKDSNVLSMDGVFSVHKKQVKTAGKDLAQILVKHSEISVETLGTRQYEKYCHNLSSMLNSDGDEEQAGKVNVAMENAMAKYHGITNAGQIAAE